jgi:Serine/threonine protein kinase
MIGTLLLNRYKVLEKIGEGGMGVVYKAKCTLLNRYVAIKILKTEFMDNNDFITRFKREANSIGSLSHPNIVNVYDFGSENNINFIVMEYIIGKTLKQLIKENVRLNTLNALDIALQITKALEYAHKNNIIHRDIKPDNILITEDNLVKLTDFGIAKVTDSATITNSSKILGSAHYFSPEQAKGNFVDYRTDIYALGAVMYEMFTGQVPFNGENSISIAMMHIQKPVVPPNKIFTPIPENINTVILKALEKEPINRFQTAIELAHILTEIKENPNLELNLNNNSIDAGTVIMMKPEKTFYDTQIDPTVVINQEEVPKTILIENNRTKLSKKKGSIKNKKLILAIGLIIFSVIVSISSKYFFKSSSTDEDKKSITAKTTVPEKSEILPQNEISTSVDEKKLVPSLKGKTQDIAENTIINSGFLLGNITTEYSDNVPKGLIISQSPAANTNYEKNEKIDLVISLGKKISQSEQQVTGNNGNGNGNGKNKDKKVKNNK